MNNGSLSNRVKRPGRETDHSLATTGVFKEPCSYEPTHRTPSWPRAYLVKHGDKFAFYIRYGAKSPSVVKMPISCFNSLRK
jgi:hypothetical protein